MTDYVETSPKAVRGGSNSNIKICGKYNVWKKKRVYSCEHLILLLQKSPIEVHLIQISVANLVMISFILDH